jgi:carbonic anhydrase
VLRIDLGNQVSFLNRASLEKTLYEIPRGGHVLIDARATDYLDPDVRDLITDFSNTTSKAHGVEVSLVGLRDHYQMADRIQFVDFTSREIQGGLTPASVLKILQAGNDRFLKGERIVRDYSRQVNATALGQFPMAVALSCIDSRAPAEVIFDLGLGDLFNIRVAGNIAATEQLGSAEYACVVARAKLLVVLGHTSCGAVNAAVDLLGARKQASEATGCGNLDNVSKRNVMRTITKVRERSAALDKLVKEGEIAIVGALYNVATGEVEFFQTPDSSIVKLDLAMA